ncbi:hypothetical protein [Desulfatibacillum aliphaticivorans]|uniref:hypothetical protein n=1 Tax=Desulfatibacillum aliphaticivorans TaxID=218208 RepID=UPI00041CE301|nr:hypothetical protein [Desulfatibacillum aliphaticivorans]
MADKTGWFDKPGNFKKFLRGFFAILIVLLIADLFVPKHPHFPWEYAPNFSAAYGFISCVLLVVVARGLRRIVMRKEDYYDS